MSRRSGKPTCNVYRRLKRRGTMNGSSQRSAIPGYSRPQPTAAPAEPRSRLGRRSQAVAVYEFRSGSPPPHRAGSDPVPKPPSPPARPSPPESSGPARAARSRSGRTRRRQQTKAPRPSCYSFPWRDLRRRANAGCESLTYSEITPPLFPPLPLRHLARSRHRSNSASSLMRELAKL